MAPGASSAAVDSQGRAAVRTAALENFLETASPPQLQCILPLSCA